VRTESGGDTGAVESPVVDEQQVFDALGFRWDRSLVPVDVPVHSVERAAFRLHKSLPEYVWDAAVLEGNPFTFPDVRTLMDGVTVGGHRLSDEGQEKRLTPGVSPGQHGRHLPEPTEAGGENLRWLHAQGLAAITGGLESAYEQALVYFLFGALQQFYFDGNKRTSRYLMNGHLMSHGIDAISVPAARAREFNTLMVDFFRFRDGTRMVAFLTDCHPDADEIVTPGMRALLT
jgi:hypothetical protein